METNHGEELDGDNLLNKEGYEGEYGDEFDNEDEYKLDLNFHHRPHSYSASATGYGPNLSSQNRGRVTFGTTNASPISTNTNDCVIHQDLPHDTSSFGLWHQFDPEGEIEGAMNEGMYTNQTFDLGGFHNDINQHLSNMVSSPFACQSSTIPELTEAQLCTMTGHQIDAY